MTDLFVYPNHPGAKSRDTSFAAADSMKGRAPTLRAKCLTVLKRGNFTADEIADFIGETVLAVRPRVSELARMGLIEDTNTRRRNASDKPAIVWRLTPNPVRQAA